MLSSHPDQSCTKSSDEETETSDRETAVETVKETETLTEDSLPNFQLESQLLQTRLEEDVLLESRNLTVDMESVKQLIAASRALKRENQALLDEYRDFKQHVLNNRCPKCLELIYQNKLSMSLVSVAGKIQFQEIQHADGVSRVFLACEQGKQNNSLDAYHNQFESASEVEHVVESRLQSYKKELFLDGDAITSKPNSEIETETKDFNSEDGCWDYSEIACQTYYGLYDETKEKAGVVQRNLVRITEIRQEVECMISANEQTTEMILDLRIKTIHQSGEDVSLNRKVIDLERQLLGWIEDFNLVLISMVTNKRKRLADEYTTRTSASARPQKSEQRTPKAEWKIADDSISAESLHHGASSTSEPSEENPDRPSKSEDDDHKCPELASIEKTPCESLPRDVPRSQSDHHKDCVLLTKRYVEDLLAEIAALKRTVLEQSRYLETVDKGSVVAADEVCFVGVERFSTKLHGEDSDCEKQTSTYHDVSRTEDKPVTPLQLGIFDAGGHTKNTGKHRYQAGQVVNWKVNSDSDERNDVERLDCQQQKFDRLQDGHGRAEVPAELKQTTGIKNAPAFKLIEGMSSEFGKLLLQSSTDHLCIERSINDQVAPGWPLEHRSSFDEAHGTTFRETNALFLRNVVTNTESSRLKRTRSEGDVDAVEFTDNFDPLHRLYVQPDEKRANFDFHEQFHSSKERFEQEQQIQRSDACLQTDETGPRMKLTSGEETAKKYREVLANLRKTCDLENTSQTGADSRQSPVEIFEEDYLSVDELLLLMTSHEQLRNENKILEDENRLLGMEIDELASRLINAEEKEDRRRLPSISEDNLEERLAEMEDRLDVKEGELSQLRKALAEKCISEKMLREKSRALQGKEEFAEMIADLEARNVELGEKTTNLAASSVDIHVNGELHGYTERFHGLETKLLEHGESLYDREQVLMGNKNDCYQCTVYLNGEEYPSAELRQMGPDLRGIGPGLRPDISRLETENRRLREEVEKWKWVKQLEVVDAESMFCVQERLASELEQLTQRLDSTSSELAARETAYRQLEEVHRHLEWEMEQLARWISFDGSQRIPESFGVGVDAFGKLVGKVRLLQAAKGDLVDENVRLAAQLETGGLHKIHEDRNGRTADEKMTEHAACNGGVSGEGRTGIYDFTSTWRIIENDGKRTSNKFIEDPVTMTIAPESVSQDYGIRNGEKSESLQSQSTVLPQPTLDVNADESPDITLVDGPSNQPVTRDMVCIYQSFVNLFPTHHIVIFF